MKAGVLVSSLAILGGVWVGVAPFLVGFAPAHAWSPAVTVSVWIGTAIVFVGLVGLVAFAAGSLGDLSRRREAMVPSAAEPEMAASEQSTGSGEAAPKLEAVEDPDEALRALVDRVLQDHSLAFDKPSR